jgi:hypothetical protein
MKLPSVHLDNFPSTLLHNPSICLPLYKTSEWRTMVMCSSDYMLSRCFHPSIGAAQKPTERASYPNGKPDHHNGCPIQQQPYDTQWLSNGALSQKKTIITVFSWQPFRSIDHYNGAGMKSQRCTSWKVYPNGTGRRQSQRLPLQWKKESPTTKLPWWKVRQSQNNWLTWFVDWPPIEERTFWSGACQRLCVVNWRSIKPSVMELRMLKRLADEIAFYHLFSNSCLGARGSLHFPRPFFSRERMRLCVYVEYSLA